MEWCKLTKADGFIPLFFALECSIKRKKSESTVLGHSRAGGNLAITLGYELPPARPMQADAGLTGSETSYRTINAWHVLAKSDYLSWPQGLEIWALYGLSS